MTDGLSVLIGLILALAGWLAARSVAGARLRWGAAAFLDAAAPMVGFAVILLITGKPLFAGVCIFALIGGFAFADWAKRAILLEPIVFTDMSEAIELFRHPELYLPFAGTARVIAGALIGVAAFAALLALEPPLWPLSLGLIALVTALVILLGWLLAGPWLGPATRLLRRLALAGDPVRDGVSFGPLAMQLSYGMIARVERPTRRLAAVSTLPHEPIDPALLGAPIVVMQCESFFDPRRLHAGIADDLLPAFDACRQSSSQWGRLAVPCWGANTVRTEFAALTGLAEPDIGYDRFNPYHGFARVPLRSLASVLREAGYRTICLHPFDRRFYGRDQVMVNLGFDLFLGQEVFADAAPAGRYVADVEVARFALGLLREHGPRTFIFGITMENHGPWHLSPQYEGPDLAPALPPMPEDADLRRFLRGTKGSDEMVRLLSTALAARGDAATLAFYGDHQPSFPASFAQLGFHDTSSDYFIWNARGGGGRRVDIAAHDLPRAILDTASGRPADR